MELVRRICSWCKCHGLVLLLVLTSMEQCQLHDTVGHMSFCNLCWDVLGIVCTALERWLPLDRPYVLLAANPLLQPPCGRPLRLAVPAFLGLGQREALGKELQTRTLILELAGSQMSCRTLKARPQFPKPLFGTMGLQAQNTVATHDPRLGSMSTRSKRD